MAHGIIATIKDLTIDKDLVLDGEFKNGKKDEAGNDIIQRKIALYSQDSNRNITAQIHFDRAKIDCQQPKSQHPAWNFQRRRLCFS